MRPDRRAISTPASGHRHVVGAPLYQGDPEVPLQVLDLHGQGGLADGAGLGRTPEMAVAGQRIEITELPERDHTDKVILSLILINPIGPYTN